MEEVLWFLRVETYVSRRDFDSVFCLHCSVISRALGCFLLHHFQAFTPHRSALSTYIATASDSSALPHRYQFLHLLSLITSCLAVLDAQIVMRT